MAHWKAHGAVFVENGRRRKGVVYLSDNAPKAKGKSKPRKRGILRRRRRR